MSLQRFVDAQQGDYARALAEIRDGRKVSHWMWYIFPQLRGLGRSGMAERYGIEDLVEARGFLADPVLGPRLIGITRALLAHEGVEAVDIFGSVDALKLRSCATLFEAAGGSELFGEVLTRFFGGNRCSRTLEMLADVERRR